MSVSLSSFLLRVCALFLPTLIFSGTVTGEFTFTKLPPAVALVYFNEDKSIPVSKGIEVNQLDKKFVQKLVYGPSGTAINFKNSDTEDHNIYANDAKTGAKFDAGLVSPGKSSKIDLNWPENSVIRISCKIHPKMQAYIANVPSAYNAIVEFKLGDKATTFTINNVPDKYTSVKVWTPKLENGEMKIKSGETQKLDFDGGSLTLNRK